MKTSTYSDQFKMHEQRGTFNGIDSYSLKYFHRFDFTSKISAESEARSLVNRMNINAILTQLTKENVIGIYIANSRRK